MSDEPKRRRLYWDGNRTGFEAFFEDFEIRAVKKGFEGHISEVMHPDLPANGEIADMTLLTRDEEKKAKKALKRHRIAVCELRLAVKKETISPIVSQTIEVDTWPYGRMWLIVKELFRKYRGDSVLDILQLTLDIPFIRMNENEHPDLLFERMWAVKRKYSHRSDIFPDDQNLIVHIINGASQTYKEAFTTRLHSWVTQGKTLDASFLSDLKDLGNNMYNATAGGAGSQLAETQLFCSLNAVDARDRWLDEIECYLCGKKGHKAYQCPNKDKLESANAAASYAKLKQNQQGTRGGGGGARGGGNGGGRQRFKGTCNLCGKVGHKAAQCWENPSYTGKRPAGWVSRKGKGNEVAQAQIALESLALLSLEPPEICLQATRNQMFPDDFSLLHDPNIWVCDTGASQHCTGHKDGMQDVRQGTSSTVGYNGVASKQELQGILPALKMDKYGKAEFQCHLEGVQYSPTTVFNLFAVTKLMREGWTFSGDDKTGFVLRKGKWALRFDIRISTKEGCVWVGYFRRNGKEAAASEISATAAINSTTMSVQRAHEILGHPSEEITRKTATHLGWTLTPGVLAPCESCAKGKGKQKNVCKDSTTPKATGPGERLFLDIKPMREPADKSITPFVKKSNMRVIVDEFTGCGFLRWFETKSGQVEPTAELFHAWKQGGLNLKSVRCDNAGENKSLEARLRSSAWKMPLDFEYTPRNSPQYNHLAELKIHLMCNRARAMMIAANVPTKYRYRCFVLATDCAMMLDWLAIVEAGGVAKPRVEHFSGRIPAFAKHLRTWGEAGTVTTKTDTQPAGKDRGVTCLMAGYVSDSTGDTYNMYDPIRNILYRTRDIIWLKRPYFQPPDIPRADPYDLFDDIVPLESLGGDSDDEDDVNLSNRTIPLTASDDTAETGTTTRYGRRVRRTQDRDDNQEYVFNAYQYSSSWTPAEEKFHTDMRELQEFGLLKLDMPSPECAAEELAMVGATGDQFEKTQDLRVMKYDEAMKDPRREKVLEGIETEHGKFLKYKVWKPIDETEALPTDKILDSTCAVKPKPNGDMRFRVVIRGFQQKEGSQYDKNDLSAPVINLITIRVVIVLIVMCSWYTHIVDVEGAFLLGRFENGERILVKVPEPFRKWYPSYVLLWLFRTIYGTKQAAMTFWKQACKGMDHMGYERSKADPCLFYCWEGGELSLSLLWVDDCLMAGPKHKVMTAKNKMMSIFDCKDIGEMVEYVGCIIERGNGWLRMTQPLQLRKFQDEFDLETHRGNPETPAEPHSVLNEGNQGDPLDATQQSDYRKGTGILLHMMRWSRPEILNAVRELSRHLKEGTTRHYKQMIRTMKYCVGKPERGATFKPERRWDGKSPIQFRISGKSDSEYMKDPSRHSVNGWACYLEGCAVNMASKMMPVIALSVTEAELYAAVQCVQDMLFVMRVLMCIGLKVELPMILEVDNKGAVDICNNWTVGGRTRHIEVKQYFLRELKENGLVKVIWKKGDDMTADLFTKNLPGPLFEKHASEYVGKDKYHVEATEKALQRKKAASTDGDGEITLNSLGTCRPYDSEYYRVWNEIICEDMYDG
jgi:hypothetical protein